MSPTLFIEMSMQLAEQNGGTSYKQPFDLQNGNREDELKNTVLLTFIMETRVLLVGYARARLSQF